MKINKLFTILKRIVTPLVVLVAFACGGDDDAPRDLDTTAPEITISGDNPLTIVQPNVYEELGATALDDTDGEITDLIEITSNVNVTIVGSYEVTYSVSDAAENSTSSTREVIVVEPDTTAPEITIIGDTPLTITLPAEYTELGATALDDIDGDISDAIVITTTADFLAPGNYEVTYSVSDAAGNATSSTREVIILEPEELDTTVPVITIIGDNPLTIKQYSEYMELGATALDDTDGDISNGIVITSTVNVDILGSYVVSYSVSDAAGNATSSTREVIVEEDTLLDGLVGKFDLDGNGNDSSGFNNHGEIESRIQGGTVYPATNRHDMDNSAMSFEESEKGYINVGDVTELRLTSSMSISIWVKISGNQVAWDDIISKWIGSGGYYFGLNENTNLRWNVSGSNVLEVTFDPEIYANKWTHLVVTYDETSSQKIYINGDIKAEQAASGPIQVTTAEFSIGGADFAQGGGQFDGEIDDIFIYDRAISASEVLELFNK